MKNREDLLQKYRSEIEELRDSSFQLILFRVANQAYGLDINKTREVVPKADISPLPHTPDYIAGIAGIRGETVLILDIAKRLGYEQNTANGYIILVEYDKYRLGLLVADVPVTKKAHGKDLTSSQEILEDNTRDETFIKSLLKSPDEIIFVMDIDELVESNKTDIEASVNE